MQISCTTANTHKNSIIPPKVMKTYEAGNIVKDSKVFNILKERQNGII